MKRFVFVVTLIFSTVLLFAKGYETRVSQPSGNTCQVSFEMGEWSSKPVTVDGVTYQKISFDAKSATEKKGWAELPIVSASICIDDQKPFEIHIISSEYNDVVFNHHLLPSRGVIYRNQDPSTIPFKVDPASIVNEMYPGNLTQVECPYIIRDVRGISILFYPFQYNAATKTLRVYKNITVEVVEKEGVGENPITQKGKLFRSYHSIYKSMFLNYGNERDALPIVNEYGDILVVTTARDEAAIEPYIQWKKEKGFGVEKLVVATGTNIVAASNNLVQAAYNVNPDIMFVQIVGDWADVKCNLGAGENAPMDPMVGCVVGTDNFPDIAVGRFSCSNAAQLTVQVNKTINYEKNPDLGNWYENAMHIASNEGAGQGDDGESDIQHEEIIWNNKLSQDTYTTQFKHYQGQSGSSASNVAASLLSGVGVINYTGHGNVTYWSSTRFSNTHINTTNNGSKLPFIFSVACVNGKFHTGTCFAEAWLQKENGGAIATTMSSINQPWIPPMAGQDYFNDILTGGYDYSTNPGNGTSTNERRTLFGNIHLNGQCLMLAESPSYNLTTAQTWHIFGDASFQVRTTQPQILATSDTAILLGTPYTAIFTANGNPVANAQICISQNDVYVSGFTDENGVVSLENTFQSGEVLLVATAFNTTTIYQNIECVSAECPYIVVESYTPESLDFGQTANISVTMKNVGSTATTSNTTVTFACSDSLLTITNGTAIYGNMSVNGEATVANAFTATVSANVTDGQTFTVVATAVNEDETWESNIILTTLQCAPPTNLTATADGSNINLAWTAPSNYGRFKIYRGNTEIATVNAISYTDANLLQGNHCYTVKTVCESGLSIASNEDCVEICQAISTTFSHTVCDAFVWNDETYTQSGDYAHTLQTIHGCDSVVTLHLTVNYSATSEFSETVCDAFVWNAQTYTQSGDYVQTLQTVHDCDSVVTLHLTVNYSATSEFSETVCDAFVWNGETYTQSGNYTQTLQTIHGCDSVVTLHLIVNYSTTSEFSETVCDSYTWNNETYTQSGDYMQQFLTVHGCDSVVTLHLTINYSTTSEFSETVCDAFVWNGETYTQSGDYAQTLQTIHGCDSVVTLHLIVNNSTTSEFSETVCDAFVWNDQTYTQSGDYVQDLQTVHNCDSVVTLHLTINYSTTSEFSETVCDEFVWNGETYTQSCDYVQSLQTVHGCDSVVTLHLTVNNSTTSEFSEIVCDAFAWNDETYTQSGDYVQTLQTIHGCDSVVTLHLTVNPSYETEIAEAICFGESFVFFGETLTESGIYEHTLQSVGNCDSLIVLTLTVNELPDVQIEGATEIVIGESVTLTASGAVSYLWSTGETTAEITVTPSDTITYSVVGTDENGCENVAEHTVNVNNVGISEVDAALFKIFPNPTNGLVNIEGENISRIEMYNSVGQLITSRKIDEKSVSSVQLNIKQYESGTYLIRIVTQDGKAVTKRLVVTR